MKNNPDITVDMHIGTKMPASIADAERMLKAPYDKTNGRSQWMWIRLCNGDLIFGCYPQGDLFEEMTQRPGMI